MLSVAAAAKTASTSITGQNAGTVPITRSIRIEWVPLDAVPGLISRGEIASGTTLALLYTITQG